MIYFNFCGLPEQDNDLSEFDESREIIESLVDEYKACESPDYIKWGMEVNSRTENSSFRKAKIKNQILIIYRKQDSAEANVAAALDTKLVV